jgi:hypothetical protein
MKPHDSPHITPCRPQRSLQTSQESHQSKKTTTKTIRLKETTQTHSSLLTVNLPQARLKASLCAPQPSSRAPQSALVGKEVRRKPRRLWGMGRWWIWEGEKAQARMKTLRVMQAAEDMGQPQTRASPVCRVQACFVKGFWGRKPAGQNRPRTLLRLIPKLDCGMRCLCNLPDSVLQTRVCVCVCVRAILRRIHT